MRTLRIPVAGLVLALAALQPGDHAAAAAKPDGKAAVAGPLHFIADDPTTALAEAKRRGVPIFVEAWAPW